MRKNGARKILVLVGYNLRYGGVIQRSEMAKFISRVDFLGNSRKTDG